MKRLLAMTLSVAALLAGGAAVRAQGPGPGGRPGEAGFGMHRPPMESILGPHGAQGRWWNNSDIVEKLKLTDEQRKSMDDILLKHREKLIDMRAAVDKAELEMEPLMRDDQPNESQILAQIDKVAQARAELEKANARFLLALRSKLSPDQWKQLQELRAQRMQERGWEGRHRGDRPGRHGDAPAPPGAPAAGPQSERNQGPGLPDAELTPGLGDR